ncbi:MAG: SDR family oxidoreductase [Caldilineaceae bacterium]|nr:SDR family oxidoreductase [Caldilineaceae bacterium]
MTTDSTWNKANIPDLTGKTALVTGANSGLGYEVSLALAEKGAYVVMACRSRDKGEQAAARIRQAVRQGSVAVQVLDLASLAAVRQFADRFQQEYPQLDILCNNAGIMAIPRRETVDGFEMQLGTNHLGHFALTGLLLQPLLQAPQARVVHVSSGLHERGSLNFEDLMGQRHYDKWGAYSQSKLANLLFAYELQRKFAAAGVRALSVGAHPGYSATNLQSVGPTMEGSFLGRLGMILGNRLLAQSAANGALPLLYAAVAPAVNGCDYIGPMGFQGMRGAPGKVKSNAASYDEASAARLWTISVEFTGVDYGMLARR